jgi:O-antigen/teichoic acid export membrane protein
VTAAPPSSTETRRTTRSGAIGLAGAAVNGAFGFVLTTVIVRTYGAAGSGALFSVIGLVTIVGAVCCLGADTGLMWAIPRRNRAEVARLLPVAVLPTVALVALVALAGFVAAGPIGRALLDDPQSTAMVRLASAGLPVIVAATVLLAAVRATRPVGVYVGVQFIFVPIARPVLMIGAVVAGGGVLLGFAGWLLPLAVAAVIALVLLGPFRRTRPADWRPFWSFALPRAASVAIDASSMWVGVLLTGALATQAEAGVFAAVGRYALAGLLIMQGLRVAIAPQLSRLLGAGQRAEAAEVYRRTTLWIVVLSWPAYLLLAVFAPAFLRLFGAPFAAGATALVVLAVAMLVNVGVGIVQTVLLMSGNSRSHLAATVAGLALNVAASVALIPHLGALGAAIAWSLGIVCENALAAAFARRAMGEPLLGPAVVRAAAAVIVAAGLAASAGLAAGGRGLPGLAVALAVLAGGCLAAVGSGRVRARLREVVREFRPGATQEVLS